MPSILAFIILLSTVAVAIRRGGLTQQKCARISAAVCPDNTLDRQQYLDHVSLYSIFLYSEIKFTVVELAWLSL